VSAPVNVKLANPTISVPDWSTQAAGWATLNREVGGNPDFYPLTVKAAYLIGVIHDICTSVTCLLQVRRELLPATYIPAYGVFASGIEILGRCILGVADTRRSDQSLKTGLKWLHSSFYANTPDSHRLIVTSSGTYDIETLAHLRHFAAHGQATANPGSAVHGLPDIDLEILGHLPPLIADGLERWWNELQHSGELCNALAKANIIAFRTWPVFKIWGLFEKDARGRYRSITEIFTEFNWRT
jgi:hypothetical protein